MDERSTHDDNELDDTYEDDQLDIDVDEADATPADTDGEPKTAEDVRERQKQVWLENIKSGKKTLDDMPDNLGWLKKDIQKEVSKPEEDEIESRVRQALKKEREDEDFSLLVEDLQSADAEKVAQVKEEYESLIADGMSQLKALVTARRLVGLKDSQSVISERRRKGMLLPPNGSRRRDTNTGDKMTEIEKRLSGGLPPGFKA